MTAGLLRAKLAPMSNLDDRMIRRRTTAGISPPPDDVAPRPHRGSLARRNHLCRHRVMAVRRRNTGMRGPRSGPGYCGMAINALIFDFDGLLMDTETTLLESWRHEWRQHGLELEVHGFFADHGGDMTEQRYADLAAAVGPEFDRAASHARRTAFREGLHRELEPAPGIRAWMDQATALGLRLAVASSSHHDWVRGNLERAGLAERFTVMACGNEVAGHKPDPAVYHLALRRLGVDPGEAIAFEDTPHGVAAAQAAGLFCVAIPNAYTPAERVQAADLVLPSAAAADLASVIAEARARRHTPSRP